MKGSPYLAPARRKVFRLFAVSVLLVCWMGGELRAVDPVVADARTSLTAQLVDYAKQLGETDLRQRSLLTATPDRIAAVVRELVIQNERRSSPYTLEQLVMASLLADEDVSNARRDLVAVEVVKAVVDQAALGGNGSQLAAVVRAALSVNAEESSPTEGVNVISLAAKQSVVGLAVTAAGSSGAGQQIAAAAFEYVVRSSSDGGLAGAKGTEAMSFLVGALTKVVGDPKGGASGLIAGVLNEVEALPASEDRTLFFDTLLRDRRLSTMPMVLGEVVGADMVGLADTEIEGELARLINQVIRGAGSRITAATPYAVGAAAGSYQQSKARLAENLIASLVQANQSPEVRGQVFSGFLRGVGAGSDSQVRQALASFLDQEFSVSETLKVGRVVTQADLLKFLDAAVTGNGIGATDLEDEARKVQVTVNVVADRLSQTFLDPKTRQVDMVRAFAAADDLGTGLIVKLAPTNPLAAGAVAEGIIESYRARGFFPEQTLVQDVTGFVATLCKNRGATGFVSNHAVMSALTGAAIGFFPGTTVVVPQLDENGNPVLDEFGNPVTQTVLHPEIDRARLVNLSTSLIRNAPNAIYPVSSRAAASLGSDQLRNFAVELAQQVAVTKDQATRLAVGVASQDPDLAPAIAKDLILLSKTTVVRGRPVTSNPFATSAESIAAGVARAVSVEKAADIGSELAAVASPTSLIKMSEVKELATALAVAINEKPKSVLAGVNRSEPVRTYNRVDELGELAAVLVGSVLGKSATQKEEYELVRDIGINILSSLSVKGLPEGLFESADATPAFGASGEYLSSAAADIIGCIAQTISFSSSLSVSQKDFLLRTQVSLGATSREVSLEKALIDYAAARSGLRTTALAAYRNALLGVFGEVRAAGYGNLVPGTEKVGVGGIPAADSTQTGKFEIGSVNDPETPVNNG